MSAADRHHLRSPGVLVINILEHEPINGMIAVGLEASHEEAEGAIWRQARDAWVRVVIFNNDRHDDDAVEVGQDNIRSATYRSNLMKQGL